MVVPSHSMIAYSIYIHIPFCAQRCSYCDFNTYAGLEQLIPAYVGALCAEIEWLAASLEARPQAHTLFFGGGTPSLLEAAQVERALLALEEAFELLPCPEISLEANPGTLSLAYLCDLRSLGVNRLSLGMQSAHPGELRLLGRQHTYPETIRSLSWARKAGFDNLNLDLIFGLPGQTLESWQRSLELALGLEPEHLSLYALSLEPGAPMAHWVARGLLAAPDPDLAAEMYEWAAERLEQHGYTQYEISNWALTREAGQACANPSLACRHNLQYWRNLPYLGLGAGAHGFANGLRAANLLAPRAYIQSLEGQRRSTASQRLFPFPTTPATQQAQSIDREAEMGETMMMGLRLTREGVPAKVFQARFGQSLEQVFGAQIERLIGLGLLEWAGEKRQALRLSPRGRLLGNQVFMEFV
ncbi:MAG: radical SAM family heme chaperone HemW [Anaerolineales bacterium]|nr:radical SAM family heme chaperone HemW [Anaerolineales bacterium]